MAGKFFPSVGIGLMWNVKCEMRNVVCDVTTHAFRLTMKMLPFRRSFKWLKLKWPFYTHTCPTPNKSLKSVILFSGRSNYPWKWAKLEIILVWVLKFWPKISLLHFPALFIIVWIVIRMAPPLAVTKFSPKITILVLMDEILYCVSILCSYSLGLSTVNISILIWTLDNRGYSARGITWSWKSLDEMKKLQIILPW